MFTTLKNHPGIFWTSLLIIGLLVWGFWPKPVLVESVHVKTAPLQVNIEEDGQTRVIDRYIIRAPVAGMTCRMHLNVGDTVQSEQTLLNITPLESPVLDSRSRAQAEAQVAAAKAALKSSKQQAQAAKANAELAFAEFQRYQSLLQKGLVSQDSFDRAKTQSQTAQAQQRSADFQVEVANYELQSALTSLQYSGSNKTTDSNEKLAIKSPINGKILKVSRECEGPVATGEALLEVGNPQALEIVVDVLSADAVKIHPGMKVLLERWGGENTLEAVVRQVEPIGFTKVSALGVEEQRVLVISDFISPAEQWQSLGDGYSVEAKFILWQDDEVLQVPSSALFRYQDGWAVFAIDNNTAKRQVVSIGQRNGLSVQILEGLNENQTIINHPSEAIEDGTAIQIRLTN
ncbi:efflux RND transporter periplasmic adaptor subunit [Thiomicrorhabdus sediminis]|uniref:Efflux RND transporter periplasmic adaptor subunit n=1 Tax=Thiomicrorhabdus sediminis TaxID=2580412 RepID=A0A4P9K577_9GAMM|nr:efflux RND transporter periplasmic adaptor subunit [Thiomicrorhabdus sediminis]QCU90008.1 efflux RND transporter periplasmic adaptor subunit [Thiomicrorhabdus sediminis]